MARPPKVTVKRYDPTSPYMKTKAGKRAKKARKLELKSAIPTKKKERAVIVVKNGKFTIVKF